MKHTDTALTLRALALLLSYPDASLRQNLPELRAVLKANRRIPAARQQELDALITQLERKDSISIEADYVELFDCGRATSLHLFEHVHGDSRDRGPAMIDLVQTYEKAGLYLAPDELPDYLPTVLEFVSTQPDAEARAFLGEMAHILNAVFNALQKRESLYAAVLGTLLELCGEKARAVKVATDEPLDEAWEEPVVFDGCSVKGQSATPTVQPIHLVRPDAAQTNATRAQRPAMTGAQP